MLKARKSKSSQVGAYENISPGRPGTIGILGLIIGILAGLLPSDLVSSPRGALVWLYNQPILSN